MNCCLLGAGALGVEKHGFVTTPFSGDLLQVPVARSACHMLSLPPSHCCHHGYMLLGVAFPPPPPAVVLAQLLGNAECLSVPSFIPVVETIMGLFK